MLSKRLLGVKFNVWNFRVESFTEPSTSWITWPDSLVRCNEFSTINPAPWILCHESRTMNSVLRWTQCYDAGDSRSTRSGKFWSFSGISNRMSSIRRFRRLNGSQAEDLNHLPRTLKSLHRRDTNTERYKRQKIWIWGQQHNFKVFAKFWKTFLVLD